MTLFHSMIYGIDFSTSLFVSSLEDLERESRRFRERTDAVSAETKLVVEPLSVRARLAALGLEPAELTDSLLDGAAAMALATGTNHPPIFGGLSFWAETVKALRDRKMRHGWNRSDARNYSTVVSPDRTFQVAVARGDEWTGRENAPNGKPSTQYRKGIATQLAVETNHQLSLFDEVPEPEEEATDAPIITRVLLHYREKHQIRCELSQPTAMNKLGFFEEWSERIILGVIDLDPTRISLPNEPPVEPEVFIRRRS